MGHELEAQEARGQAETAGRGAEGKAMTATDLAKLRAKFPNAPGFDRPDSKMPL